jgi:glycine/D-amino acid oxidase-like deaminating enzyme
VMAYRACERAILDLEDIAADTGAVGFRRMSSLYFASRWHHAGRLRREGLLRKRHGFKLELLERDELRERCGIRAPVGLLTATAAQVDPYRMTYALLRKLRRKGVQIFDRSGMLTWSAGTRDVELQMERDVVLRCKHLVLAAGYEAQQYLPVRVASNRSSYALVTEPVGQHLGALKDMLVWESARPYLYLRTTDDGRVLVGGEDDRIDIAAKRDASVPRKASRLLRKLQKLLPDIAFENGFAWAGTFAETKDGLPFFGPHPKLHPRVHFAMAYGGNGITYSALGAQILRARLTGRKHPLMQFFSFERLS